MHRPLVALALLSLLVAALPLGVDGQGPGVQYKLIIGCPEAGFAATCPVRATDEQDMMGDPAVAVDPDIPDHLIIASLHGSGDSGGPTVKSRSGLAFTTFTSTDHGRFWTDNPFSPPSDLPFNSYGEHPAITIDPFGAVYVGSLYAVEVSNNIFDYVIVAQNFSSIGHIDDVQDGEYSAVYIPPNLDGNRIGQMWFRYDAPADRMALVWHEAVTSASNGNASDLPRGLRHLDQPLLPGGLTPIQEERLGRPGHAGLAEGLLGATGLEPSDGHQQAPSSMGMIGLVWRDPVADDYFRLPAENAIGPCDRATNPVLSEGFLYVGCRVGAGHFRWDEDVDPGQYVLFRMRTDAKEMSYLGPAPIDKGDAKLGARSDGRLALASAIVDEDGNFELKTTFGSFDDESGRVKWGLAKDQASKLPSLGPGIRVTHANVQDLIYREYSGVIQMILKQVIEVEGVGTSTVTRIAAPNILKSIVAVDETYGLMAAIDLDIGNPINRTDPALLAAPEMVYNDLSDDFLQLDPGPYECEGHDLGPQYSREFFAVGDYGTVIFAEVCEVTTLRGPAFLPPPVGATPILAPAASSSVATVLVPAAGLTVASLMAASFIVNRRKSVSAAVTKRRP